MGLYSQNIHKCTKTHYMPLTAAKYQAGVFIIIVPAHQCTKEHKSLLASEQKCAGRLVVRFSLNSLRDLWGALEQRQL